MRWLNIFSLATALASSSCPNYTINLNYKFPPLEESPNQMCMDVVSTEKCRDYLEESRLPRRQIVASTKPYATEFLHEKTPKRVLQKYQQLISHRSQTLEERIQKAARFYPEIKQSAEENNIPLGLWFSLVLVESGGNHRAESRAGARGLVQLTKSAAVDMNRHPGKYGLKEKINCRKYYDPEINSNCGAAFLSYLKTDADKKYPHLPEAERWDLAVSGYNRGKAGLEKSLNRSRSKSFWDLPVWQVTAEVYHYTPRVRAYQLLLRDRGLLDEGHNLKYCHLGKEEVVLLAGSSTLAAEDYRKIVQPECPQAKFIYRANNGQYLEKTKVVIQKILSQQKITQLVFNGGLNEIASGEKAEKVIEDLDQIISLAEGYSITPIFVNLQYFKGYKTWKDEFKEQIDLVNAYVQDQEAKGRIKVANFNEAVGGIDSSQFYPQQINSVYTTDYLHANTPAGQKKLSQIILKQWGR